MEWRTLTELLFPEGHSITEIGSFLSGEAKVNGSVVRVIGTTDHIAIGVEIAMAQARAILDTIQNAPGQPIVILIDTQGQRLRHRDEMLGINGYMAHLGKCIDQARRSGHPIIGLVYDQALSGGFITSGLMADACYALPDATIRVMGLPAMARITKVAEERLTLLAKDNPVFAPGVQNYYRMGGVHGIWSEDLASALKEAINSPIKEDTRHLIGDSRGGRKLAASVIEYYANGENAQ
jgi:malonate decarboxylase gamma subunit